MLCASGSSRRAPCSACVHLSIEQTAQPLLEDAQRDAHIKRGNRHSNTWKAWCRSFLFSKARTVAESGTSYVCKVVSWRQYTLHIENLTTAPCSSLLLLSEQTWSVADNRSALNRLYDANLQPPWLDPHSRSLRCLTDTPELHLVIPTTLSIQGIV